MDFETFSNGIDSITVEEYKTARELPIETKKVYWRSFYEDKETMGEARKRAGIDDLRIAIALTVQCWKLRSMPMEVDEIE